MTMKIKSKDGNQPATSQSHQATLPSMDFHAKASIFRLRICDVR